MKKERDGNEAVVLTRVEVVDAFNELIGQLMLQELVQLVKRDGLRWFLLFCGRSCVCGRERRTSLKKTLDNRTHTPSSVCSPSGHEPF